MKDPCEKLEKEASRKSSILRRDNWSGGILFIQAAECYKASGKYEKAYKMVRKAVNLLKKYASKYGYEMVINDIVRALTIAYKVAKGKEKEKTKIELFHMMNLKAKHMETSGNYIGAIDTYKKAIEYAPSGEDAIKVLTHASEVLERIIEQKARLGKDALVNKLMDKLEEIKMMIPTIQTISEKATVSAAIGYEIVRVTARYKIDLSLPARAVPDMDYDDRIQIINKELIDTGVMETNINEREGIVSIVIRSPGNELFGEVSIDKKGDEVIIQLEGKDALFTLRQYYTLREIIERNIPLIQIVNQNVIGFITREALIEILNRAKEKVLLRRSYNQIKVELNTALDIIREMDIGGELEKVGKMLEKMIRKINRVMDPYMEVLDFDAEELQQNINKAIKQIRMKI